MELEDVYDVEAFAREHRKLMEGLMFAMRTVTHGKFIVNVQDGRVIGSEIHRYERTPAQGVEAAR